MVSPQPYYIPCWGSRRLLSMSYDNLVTNVMKYKNSERRDKAFAVHQAEMKGLFALAAGGHIEDHGQDEHGTAHDVLPGNVDGHQVHTAGQ